VDKRDERQSSLHGEYYHTSCVKKRRYVADLEQLMTKIRACETEEQDRKKRDAKEALEILPPKVQNGDNEALRALIKVLKQNAVMLEQEHLQKLEDAEEVVEAGVNELKDDGVQTLFNDYVSTHRQRQNRFWKRWHERKIRELEAQEANGPGCDGCDAGGQYHDKYGSCSFCFTVVMQHPELYPGGALGCPYYYHYT
jgi:hypothetical protein